MIRVLRKSIILTLVFQLVFSTGGLAQTRSYSLVDSGDGSQVFNFFQSTDKYDSPSSKVEKELDKLLTNTFDQKDKSKLIYRYIMYRDQKEIVHFFNPTEDTIFTLDKKPIPIESIDDFSDINDAFNDLDALVKDLLPLGYKITIYDDEIYILDDYEYLLDKYGDQSLFEPFTYLKIMNIYTKSPLTPYSTSSDEVDLDELIALISMCENFMAKPYKDFAFDHVREIYSDIVPIFYEGIVPLDRPKLEEKLQDKLPESLVTASLSTYFDLLDDEETTASQLQAFIQDTLDQQIKILTLK